MYWTQLPVRGETVVAWIGGPKAGALRALPKSELIHIALEGFGKMFGDVTLAMREFAGAETHDWGGDPFARGAYSYVAVGGAGARAAFAEPLADSLFFAGEATSTDGQGGTVNGALASGQRAAREVIDSLCPTKAADA